MRLLSSFGRLDSRNLLKLLITINIVLAFYQLISFHFYSPPEACILNIRPSPLIQDDSSSKQILSSLPDDSKLLRFSSNTQITNGGGDKSESAAVAAVGAAMIASESLDSPTVQLTYKPKSPWWIPEQRERYIVIRNYILPEAKNPNTYLQSANETLDENSVTLTTQGTFEFLNHVESLCKRWDGPISVGVYAPGEDILYSLELIYFMRSCRHECVLHNVTWHLIYDVGHGPDKDNVTFPEDYVNKMSSTGTAEFNCQLTYDDFFNKHKDLYRVNNKLPYPINVARNVARLNIKTKYLLASDIELYPSLNVVSMFRDLLEREKNNLVPLVNRNVPHVYVLPIFEVKAGLDPPLTKKDLIKMVKKGDAIFFHKWVCDICQNFPDRDKWIESVPSNDSFDIFRSAKRTHARSTWEPLYIGTNAEPLYEEKLSWEGKRDKMSQMFEMCLLNYDLLILNNAYLVHAPGIKHIDHADDKKRLPFIKRNNQVYTTVISKLRRKYIKTGNKEC
ncbi:beta-1,4-glucuronyltransferase 1-like [Panonychus citri]|uniref:beta-1,4-glucuronyltransferase 1-like n=1 Tax=Panonychus citri TaxID=50023 RepID=UPI002307BF2D|nr:beta-1,4-glucuronyltransferase 1-like [Panonychus citri]XP_053203390.1 beta-1,4-glucuronyltransferase 1-like [Panonychus citri]